VINFLTPRSTPIADFDGWIGISVSSVSVQNETYQRPDTLLIVTFFIVPRISCDFLNLITPTPLGSLSLFPLIQQYLSNCTRRMES